MPVYLLDHRLLFPRPESSEPSGVLAVGGDLRPERLLLGYSMGIFPWYEDGVPILWHSPDPRTVLEPRKIHVARSLRKAIRKKPFEIRFDTAFADVLRGCAGSPRPGQQGTWITDDMKEAYSELHRLGFAHSAEAWRDGQLVGGLYGVCLGGMFFGESMFARAADASKIAFVALVEWLENRGIELIDCQVETEHLERFGAESWPRSKFLSRLTELVNRPTLRGRWTYNAPGAEPEPERAAGSGTPLARTSPAELSSAPAGADAVEQGSRRLSEPNIVR